MKIALVLPGSLWYAPYVRIYTRILDSIKANYSIISWNREGDDVVEGFQYNELCKNGHGSAGFSAYIGYIRFIKQTINENDFDRIIVFGPQLTCFLSYYLLTKFRGRYMIDYRDLSIEQKLGFKQLFSLMLKFSFANVISSPGFKRCLPKRNDYVLSHNFDVDAVKNAIKDNKFGDGFKKNDVIDVLTIGAIRDLSSNMEVVESLANKEGFLMRFVGKGDAAEIIKDYCIKNAIVNVIFKGFYQKVDESNYVQTSTFLNIFYPRVITHDTALSNRFYNSLIYKKPMIVTKNTTQGDYAEKYKVGVAVDNCLSLCEDLHKFLEEDFGLYAIRCNELLKSFLIDQENFEKIVQVFATDSSIGNH